MQKDPARIDLGGNMNTLLTNSSLTAFKTCPRKYQIKYELGYVPNFESEALQFGKLFHYGLEQWANSGKNIATALRFLECEFARSENQDLYMLSKAAALLEGYHAQYKDEPYEIVFAEKEFRAPIINPETMQGSRTFKLGGVMDRIIKDKQGRFVLLETKTTSENIEDPASNYWIKLFIDSQISTYFTGAAACGIIIESCLYDVIKKPTIRPKQVGKEIDPDNPKRQESPQEYYERLSQDIALNPNFYFARREITRSDSDIMDFVFDTWNIVQTLRTYQLKNKFPRYTNACKGNFGYCEYFNACTGQTLLEDEQAFKKIEQVHQELNSKIGGSK